MKQRIFFFCLFVMISVISRAAVDDIITPTSGKTILYDANGKLVENDMSQAELACFKFKILTEYVDADNLGTVEVYSFSYLTGTTSGNVIVPGEVTYEVGGDIPRTYVVTKAVNSFSKVNGELTFSEGVTHFASTSVLNSRVTALHFPSTLSNWVNVTYPPRDLREITIAKNNNYFEVDDTKTMLYTNLSCSGTRSLWIVSDYKQDENGGISPNTNVKIPEGITSLLVYFGVEVETIRIPSTVTKIVKDHTTGGIFTNARSLKEFIVADGNTVFSSKDGILYSKDGTILHKVPRAKYAETDTVTIDEGVTTIEQAAFKLCQMKSIKLHDNIDTIKSCAFTSCSNITEISIGKKVKSIGAGILVNCGNLSKITVDKDNEYYKTDTAGVLFTHGLDTLLVYPTTRARDYKVPSATTFIGSQAFQFSRVTSIDLGNVKRIGTYAFYGSKLSGTLTIPDSVKYIENSGFSNNNINKLIVGKNLEGTGIHPFASLTNLTEVEFAEECKLETLNNYFFSNCPKLKSITLPPSITEIGNSALGGSTGITEITIPASVTTIGMAAFPNGLKSISFEAGSRLNSLSKSCFSNCTNLTTVSFGVGCQLQTIGEGCFRNLTQLTEVDIPATTTTIGASAFNGCTNLTKVNFESGSKLTTLGASVFQNCGLKSITLPEGLQTIEKEAFLLCNNLDTVRIPGTVTSVDPQAFLLSKNLRCISVDDKNAKYASIDGMLTNKTKTQLLCFPAGKANKTITLLSPSFTEIGKMAFVSCSQLTNITLPKKIEKIGVQAFYACNNLNSITFLGDEPISAANIGANAFGNKNTSAEDFLDKDKNKNLVINVRKNGNEGMYGADTCYWKNCKIQTSIEEGNNEYLPMSEESVSILKSSSTKTSCVIPKKVSLNGKEYKVSMIADYAFEDISEKVEEIILRGPIEYVGSCAFYKKRSDGTKTSNIKSVFFTDWENVGTNELSTARFGLGEDYNEFLGTQNIYVAKSKEQNYKDSWTKFGSQITYKITFPTISTKFGTLSREFDVDLQDDNNNWNDALGKPSVIAFTGKVSDFDYTDPTTGEKVTGIIMSSINCGATDGTDGTYIPANTGVLMRAYTSDQKSPKDFYYRIGEKTITKPVDNIMECVTEESRTISSTETVGTDTYTNYIISGGKYWSIAAGQSVTIPAHKSYMHIKTSGASGAKIMLFFDEGGDTTGITVHDAPESSAMDGSAIYDLTGRRVSGNASRGLYLVNGKKYVKK